MSASNGIKEALKARERYRANGRVNLARFTPLAGVSLVVALLMAVVLHLLWRAGCYYVAIVPLATALAVSGCVFMASRVGHCRNYLLGGALGAAAGAFMYLGHFHVGLVEELGLAQAHRLDLLPRYIVFRMETQQLEDSTLPTAPDDEIGTGDLVFNWLFFVLELGISLALPFMAGANQAPRAYCDECDEWMAGDVLGFPANTGPRFLAALLGQRSEELRALPKCGLAPNQPACLVVVECCRCAHQRGNPGPVYLSVKEAKMVSAINQANLSASLGRPLCRQISLEPEETAQLLPLVPSLATHVPPAAVEAVRLAAVSDQVHEGVCARIEPV